MTKTFQFNLTRPARKAGGDRYEYEEKGHPDFMVLYFPQSISRPNGVPLDSLSVTVEGNETSND